MTEPIPTPDKHKTGLALASEADGHVTENMSRDGAHLHHKKAPQHTPDSSYQNYLFGSAGSTGAPAWSDSIKGRFLIRMVSRGLVGATFFAIGGRMASQQLDKYNPETWKWDSSKPLQAIAKGFDATLGKGIEKTVSAIARFKYPASASKAEMIGKRAVTFRDSRNYPGSGIPLGRSYGADIVGFTFDFAMASIGDASARSIIQAFDPNVKKKWLVNDDGAPAARGERKHFLPGEWLKAVGKTSWRVLTKNQGEDWAAAIPYAFQMKFQRQFLSNVCKKRWDGHQLVFDQGWNGGAYRVNTNGQIVRDYQLVGAIDLHARFVGYNWYTLMFREGYDAIGNAYNRWKENGYKISIPLPEHFNPITTPIDGALHAARYVTKSFIKANMYMNPAVCFFWPFRVAQSKWRGGKVVKEIAGGAVDWGASQASHVADPFSGKLYAQYAPPKDMLDRFERGFSRVLNPLGWASYKLGEGVASGAERVYNKGLMPKGKWFTGFLAGETGDVVKGGRRFAHEVVDAAVSYTPYMFAKQEFGLRVDDTKGDGKLGQMDTAIYKFMDDVAAFKLGAIPADLKKMWKLGISFEREVKVREGGEVDGKPTENSYRTPASTIQTSSIRQVPVLLSQASAANDARYRSGHSSNDAQFEDEQRWAKRVSGSDVNPAQVHHGSPTIH